MSMSWIEPAYESARAWALRPVSHPPPGWIQIVRGGVAAWIQATPPPCGPSSLELCATPAGGSPLLALVAAMIAQVSR